MGRGDFRVLVARTFCVRLLLATLGLARSSQARQGRTLTHSQPVGYVSFIIMRRREPGKGRARAVDLHGENTGGSARRGSETVRPLLR